LRAPGKLGTLVTTPNIHKDSGRHLKIHHVNIVLNNSDHIPAHTDNFKWIKA